MNLKHSIAVFCLLGVGFCLGFLFSGVDKDRGATPEPKGDQMLGSPPEVLSQVESDNRTVGSGGSEEIPGGIRRSSELSVGTGLSLLTVIGDAGGWTNDRPRSVSFGVDLKTLDPEQELDIDLGVGKGKFKVDEVVNQGSEVTLFRGRIIPFDSADRGGFRGSVILTTRGNLISGTIVSSRGDFEVSGLGGSAQIRSSRRGLNDPSIGNPAQ